MIINELGWWKKLPSCLFGELYCSYFPIVLFSANHQTTEQKKKERVKPAPFRLIILFITIPLYPGS